MHEQLLGAVIINGGGGGDDDGASLSQGPHRECQWAARLVLAMQIVVLAPTFSRSERRRRERWWALALAICESARLDDKSEGEGERVKVKALHRNEPIGPVKSSATTTWADCSHPLRSAWPAAC